ncbi:solute carrier family 52, riboflavin transporter, member 3-B-like [Ylistrum balloti]|uniref:solute carrier family 52, riboflavin transporter, member 3-B-like n=1 Tax=Ylistrum balloti TaxID=509963 RepID=UPI0029059349|nr:solute carrier family 52, riboflavin transporter, member 3-B-like [Ylistrum balloti]
MIRERWCRYGEINILLYITVIIFGIGSWVAVNGLLIELPVIVPHLPEGWTLPSYLIMIIQPANIGPIVVTLAYVRTKDTLNEKVVIYIILTIGTLACLLLSLFWKNTSFVAGEERSTALLTLHFFLSIVDCTSSVLFLPFMSLFKVEYMTGYFIGEGMSGLIPSLVALGQGVGKISCENVSVLDTSTNLSSFEIQTVYKDPYFPVEHFFLFLCAMMVLCGTAFSLLNYLPYFKKEHVTLNNSDERSRKCNKGNLELQNQQKVNNYETVESLLHDKESFVKLKVSSAQGSLSTKTFVYLLCLVVWINALTNGVLPSLQTYSCLPYGYDAYHLAMTLANIANPSACIVALILPVPTSLVISLLTLVGTCLSIFIVTTAVQSPFPVMYDDPAGPYIVVTTWILMTFLMVFSKVSLATLFRKQGKRALLWCGAMTQVGSLSGGIITYLLVNVAKTFHSAAACS